jgi:hypothetical protein
MSPAVISCGAFAYQKDCIYQVCYDDVKTADDIIEATLNV